MTGYGRFRDPERRFFDQNAAELHVSVVSIWEMRLKYNSRRASGERKSPFDPNDVLATLEGLGIALLTITPHHSARELATPIPHSDPLRRTPPRAGPRGRSQAPHNGPSAHRSPPLRHAIDTRRLNAFHPRPRRSTRRAVRGRPGAERSFTWFQGTRFRPTAPPPRSGRAPPAAGSPAASRPPGRYARLPSRPPDGR